MNGHDTLEIKNLPHKKAAAGKTSSEDTRSIGDNHQRWVRISRPMMFLILYFLISPVLDRNFFLGLQVESVLGKKPF